MFRFPAYANLGWLAVIAWAIGIIIGLVYGILLLVGIWRNASATYSVARGLRDIREVLVTRERPAPPPAQQAPGQQPPAKT
jgi:hypothetical protein